MLIDLLMLTLESIHPVHPVHPVHPADWTCFEIHKHRGIVASQLSVPQDSSAPHPGLLALLQDHWVTSQDFKSTAQMQFLLRIILRHGHLCKCFRSFGLHVHHQRHAVLICFHYLLYVSLPGFCNCFFLRPQQLHEVLGTIFTLILRSLLCYSELRLLNAQDARDDWISREMRVRVMHVVPRCLSKNVNHLLLRSGTKSRLLRE